MIRDESNLNFAIKTSFHSDSRKEKEKKKIKKEKLKLILKKKLILLF
jgi:hypothetical protein